MSLSFLIFPDENNIAKLVLNMWENYFNKLWSIILQFISNKHDF